MILTKLRRAYHCLALSLPDALAQVEIRPALPADAAAIAEIYNQGIEDRVATFETEPRSASDIEPWLAKIEQLPLLVAEREGRLAGWAHVSVWDERRCYSGVGEYTIYVDRSARGKGVGGLLLEATCDEWQRRGNWKLIGLLFASNAPSIALARSCGFREVGTHARHAQLEGEWKDTVVFERLMGAAAS